MRRWIILALLLAACAEQGTERVLVGYVADARTSTDAVRGAMLGAEEVAHTARLLGRTFELKLDSARDAKEAEALVGRLARAGAAVIVGGYDAGICEALSRAAETRQLVYIADGCATGEAHDYTFRIRSSNTQCAGSGACTIWHGRLERFGATQLNQRFVQSFGRPAEADAWASWFALKVAGESALNRGLRGSAVREFLQSDSAEFDGHKGQPLRFDPQSHELLQPLYAIGDDGAPAALETKASVSAVVGAEALRAAMREGASLVLVSNEASNDVTVVDTRTHQPIATITLLARPRGLSIHPDGSRAFIALSDDVPNAANDGDAVVEVDLTKAELTRAHDAGSDPEQFALSPDGRLLYAANEDAGTATIADLASGDVLATLIVGIEPEGVAASPDGRWVYVTAETSNTVTVIDAQTQRVANTFLVGTRPRAVTFSPDSRFAYVSNEISGSLSIVDAQKHVVLASIPLDGGRAKPVGIAVSPDGARVYIANGHTHNISVVDAAARREIATVPVGRRPWGIAISGDGRYLYVANGGSNDLSVVDATALRVVATIPVGQRPWGVAVTPQRAPAGVFERK